MTIDNTSDDRERLRLLIGVEDRWETKKMVEEATAPFRHEHNSSLDLYVALIEVAADLLRSVPPEEQAFCLRIATGLLTEAERGPWGTALTPAAAAELTGALDRGEIPPCPF